MGTNLDFWGSAATQLISILRLYVRTYMRDMFQWYKNTHINKKLHDTIMFNIWLYLVKLPEEIHVIQIINAALHVDKIVLVFLIIWMFKVIT